MDLALLRLDAVAALCVAGGQPGAIEIAHLLPQPLDGQSWAVIKSPGRWARLTWNSIP